MTFIIRPFCMSDANTWDLFCEEALQATFLHTRLFLSYHGDRFVDQSLIIEEDNRIIGLFPAAISNEFDRCVSSHPGITYGGMLHKGQLRGEKMINVMTEISFYYHALGFTRLLYKAIPTIYQRSPAQDDEYALFSLGADITRIDLSATINLFNRLPASQRRRRSRKKALRFGVNILEGPQYLQSFWNTLSFNLELKHGVKPVHSIAEIMLLVDRFPQSIKFIGANIGEEIVAGILLFITPSVYHAQYIASSEKGAEISALDLVFEHSIASAIEEEKHWFDFGVSTESNGKILNDGLHRFKCEFGGGGGIHNFYDLDLSKLIV